MDGRPNWTDCDEAGDYVVPNVLKPRDRVFRPDNMDENCITHTVLIVNNPPFCVEACASSFRSISVCCEAYAFPLTTVMGLSSCVNRY